MFKKFLNCLLLFFTIPFFVNASSNSAAKIGDKYYDNLADAIANASSGDIIMLTSNVVLEDTLLINKVINLNLNGHDISVPTMAFQVQGGTLNLNGSGTVRETEPNYGAIMVKGSSDPSDTEYSIINVGADVTLEGWSGIFISHDSSKSYGVVINFAGKINAVDDVSGGSGIGIYVNGKIQEPNHAPVVNILDGAQIASSGNGLYIAGYSTFNIGKTYISGIESGIGIKSGILNIDGATVVCHGEDDTPTEGYNNGMNASGTTIQIESNSGYAGNMELSISSGIFQSKNSNVIYEYIGKGTNTLVDSIKISGGTFSSDVSKDVFQLSDSFQNKHSNFITGGKYSSDPSSYLQSGYTSVLENNLFQVTKSTMKEVTTISELLSSSKNSIWKFLLIFMVLGIFILLVYFNRAKVLKVFKN